MRNFTKSQFIGFVLLLISLTLIIRIWLFGNQSGNVDAILMVLLQFGTIMLGIVMVGHAIPILFDLYLALTETGNRNPQKIINPPQLPKHLADWQDELFRLGFEKFGAYSSGNQNNMSTAWTYIDPSQTIVAQVAHITHDYEFLYFGTRFEDDFSIEIAYQNKLHVNVDHKYIFTANLTTSIAATYDYHLYKCDEAQSKHGNQLIFKTMQDFMPNQEIHRKHMVGIHSSRMFDRLKLFSVFLCIMISLSIGLFLLPSYGAWLATAIVCFGSGITLSIVNFDKIQSRFRPIDERKTRKAHSQ